MNASALYLGYILLSGEPLSLIECEAMQFYELAVAKNQESALVMLRPIINLVRTFMGKTDDGTLKLGGGEESIHTGFPQSQEEHVFFVSLMLRFFQCQTFYIFCDYEAAAAEAEKMRIDRVLPYTHPGYSTLFTFHALALLAVIRNCRRQSSS